MKRLTKQGELSGHYVVDAGAICRTDGGYTGKAIDRLAALENLYEELEASIPQLSQKLEALRAQGKTNSCRFRETMGQKLLNNQVLSVLRASGAME